MLQIRQSTTLLSFLRCPRCSGAFDQSSPKKLKCSGCASLYDIDKGVPILWGTGSRGSQLEHVDYDALQPINPATTKHVGLQWRGVFDDVFGHPPDVLEIGAGTGILTAGLLEYGDLRSLIVTDVSRKFMLALGARSAVYPPFKGAVVSDANETVFAPNSFDLVVGRSILHHLIDYPIVLKNVSLLLRPGGAAVFFEPVLEGKSLVSLACSLILHADQTSATPRLAQQDIQAIQKMLRHQTKHAWYPQTREELSKLEDKYIFGIREMYDVGIDAGFAAVEFLDRQKSDPTYWSYIQNTLRMAGVDVKTLQHFKWIGDAIKDSYFCSTNKIPTPMGFFVFRKQELPNA